MPANAKENMVTEDKLTGLETNVIPKVNTARDGLETSAMKPVSREVLIRTSDLWKTYVMGEEEIHALRGFHSRSKKANTSPSSARQVQANQR